MNEITLAVLFQTKWPHHLDILLLGIVCCITQRTAELILGRQICERAYDCKQHWEIYCILLNVLLLGEKTDEPYCIWTALSGHNMTCSYFFSAFLKAPFLYVRHKREWKFYMESLHLDQFREPRRCAGIRGAHCSVTANRNFLTQHRLIKRAGEGRKSKHSHTNVILPQKYNT